MAYKLRFLFIYICPGAIHKRSWHLTTWCKINVSGIIGVKEEICKFISFVRVMTMNIRYLNLKMVGVAINLLGEVISSLDCRDVKIK
jgi:hypothetical protein